MSENSSESTVEVKDSNENIPLGSICPREGKFFLSSRNKEYTLRKVNLDDQVWMKETFKDEEHIQRMMEGMDVDSLSKFAYHQLKLEDKKDFLAADIEDVNDDGELVKRRLKGYEVFRQAASGTEEFINIYKALLHTIGISQPIIDQATSQRVDEEKKSDAIKKK